MIITSDVYSRFPAYPVLHVPASIEVNMSVGWSQLNRDFHTSPKKPAVTINNHISRLDAKMEQTNPDQK